MPTFHNAKNQTSLVSLSMMMYVVSLIE